MKLLIKKGQQESVCSDMFGKKEYYDVWHVQPPFYGKDSIEIVATCYSKKNAKMIVKALKDVKE